MLSERVIYRENPLGMWAAASIHTKFTWWNEKRQLEQGFSFSATWPLWGELLCPVTMAWSLWNHQPTETFLFLSSLLGYLLKWKKIWLWFCHHIEKWWVLKEVWETSVWSLSLKKCAGLCSLVLWLPGVRWVFSSQTHSSHWHVWQDTIERALTATEWMRSLPPPLNL